MLQTLVWLFLCYKKYSLKQLDLNINYISLYFYDFDKTVTTCAFKFRLLLSVVFCPASKLPGWLWLSAQRLFWKLKMIDSFQLWRQTHTVIECEFSQSCFIWRGFVFCVLNLIGKVFLLWLLLSIIFFRQNHVNGSFYKIAARSWYQSSNLQYTFCAMWHDVV